MVQTFDLMLEAHYSRCLNTFGHILLYSNTALGGNLCILVEEGRYQMQVKMENHIFCFVSFDICLAQGETGR